MLLWYVAHPSVRGEILATREGPVPGQFLRPGRNPGSIKPGLEFYTKATPKGSLRLLPHCKCGYHMRVDGAAGPGLRQLAGLALAAVGGTQRHH